MRHFIYAIVILLVAFSLSIIQSKAQTNNSIRFAVIGDYGEGEEPFLGEVSAMIDSWDVDFIVTVGDNNYPDGEYETIDANIGQYFHDYIYPYQGEYGEGSDVNRFYPALGNHDWTTDDAQPYFDYFTLPGNERYYDFIKGPVHFFVVSSDDREPDGNTDDSPQANWLREQLTSSTAPWKVVVMHDPPYSSGEHGDTADAQWTYKEWGADAVLSGHDHHYERLIVDDLPYFVIGSSGDNLRSVDTVTTGSEFIFSGSHGAMLVQADDTQMTFEFYSINGVPLSWLNTGIVEDWIELDVTDAIEEDGLYEFAVTTGSNTSIYLTSTEGCDCDEVPQLIIEDTDGNTLNFVAVDDTYTRVEHAGRNYGDEPELRLRNSSQLDIATFLRFSVIGVPDNIEKATLHLYIESGEVKGGFSVFSMPAIGSTIWTQDTLTHDMLPPIVGENVPLDTYTIMNENG